MCSRLRLVFPSRTVPPATSLLPHADPVDLGLELVRGRRVRAARPAAGPHVVQHEHRLVHRLVRSLGVKQLSVQIPLDRRRRPLTLAARRHERLAAARAHRLPRRARFVAGDPGPVRLVIPPRRLAVACFANALVAGRLRPVASELRQRQNKPHRVHCFTSLIDCRSPSPPSALDRGAPRSAPAG